MKYGIIMKRGEVKYVFDSPFKQWSFLGNLTGLIYWTLNPPALRM